MAKGRQFTARSLFRGYHSESDRDHSIADSHLLLPPPDGDHKWYVRCLSAQMLAQLRSDLHSFAHDAGAWFRMLPLDTVVRLQRSRRHVVHLHLMLC